MVSVNCQALSEILWIILIFPLKNAIKIMNFYLANWEF